MLCLYLLFFYEVLMWGIYCVTKYLEYVCYVYIGHFFEMDPFNPIPQVREKSMKKSKLRADGVTLIVGMFRSYY